MVTAKFIAAERRYSAGQPAAWLRSLIPLPSLPPLPPTNIYLISDQTDQYDAGAKALRQAPASDPPGPPQQAGS